ncbi:MAG TPA: hypothetical protein VGD78_14145 [Chthoniobacterales bacterium]
MKAVTTDKPVLFPGPSPRLNRQGGWGLLAVLVLAVGYYGSYALSGLDFMGEGGTVAVIAQRLAEGQKPIVDTFLGYNVLWFYPIVGLFKVFGPSFTAIRFFFFTLCTLTALIGCKTVYRATGRIWLAVGTGILLVLVPGMQFRNYMGLLPVANLALLGETVAGQHRSSLKQVAWIAAEAVLLGLTFLIRIDLGLFLTVLILGVLAVRLAIGPGSRLERLGFTGIFLLLLPLGFALTHWPVDAYAARHGFRREFWAQYTYWAAYVQSQALTLIPRPSPAGKPLPPGGVPVSPAPPQGETKPKVQEADRRPRPLPPLKDVFLARRAKQRELAYIIYYPVFAILVLGAALLFLFVKSFRRPGLRAPCLWLALGLGVTSTLFPQYLFFRPDPPHVSEMMCPFIVLAALTLEGAMACIRQTPSRALRWTAAGWIALTVIHLAIYVRYGLKQPSMGSIALRQPHAVRFVADNGVAAYLPATLKRECQQLYQVIHRYAGPDDYVVCYPYGPTVNFMTNRPSYQWNLYVDNVTRPSGFDAQTIAQMERYRPAVVLVDDVPMNETPSSRFSGWAAATLAYVRNKYHYVGTYMRNEVYVRDFDRFFSADR